jgi:hypothetical protein
MGAAAVGNLLSRVITSSILRGKSPQCTPQVALEGQSVAARLTHLTVEKRQHVRSGRAAVWRLSHVGRCPRRRLSRRPEMVHVGRSACTLVITAATMRLIWHGMVAAACRGRG